MRENLIEFMERAEVIERDMHYTMQNVKYHEPNSGTAPMAFMIFIRDDGWRRAGLEQVASHIEDYIHGSHREL